MTTATLSPVRYSQSPRPLWSAQDARDRRIFETPSLDASSVCCAEQGSYNKDVQPSPINFGEDSFNSTSASMKSILRTLADIWSIEDTVLNKMRLQMIEEDLAKFQKIWSCS